MTTEKSADTTTNCSGLDDSRSPIKRYDFGQNNKQGYSVPDIIEKADGRFVLYEDAFKLLKMIQLQEALLAKQAAEMEAIGAGGVSGKRITSPEAVHDRNQTVLTPEQRKQIQESMQPWQKISEFGLAIEQAVLQSPEVQALRDALWVATEHNALHFGESHNTVIQGRAALAAMEKQP